MKLGVRECDSEDEANPDIMVEHHYVLNRNTKINNKCFNQMDQIRKHNPLGKKTMNNLGDLAYIMRK